MFNRFACGWPKGYQHGSLGKSHQNGDYLQQAMRKSCLPTGIVFLWEDNFFALLVLGGHRSGDFSLGF